MQVFVVFSAVLACALSQVAYPYAYSPYGYNPYNVIPYGAYPYSAIAAPLPVVASSSQYRAGDIFGQYTFGTSEPNQGRVETKTLDGTVTGAYSYVDPTGKLISVNYLADHNGFRVLGANNLPVAPEAPVVAGPEPVMDTPEVVAARADFMMKFAEAKAAAEAAPETMSRKKRQAVFYPTPVLGYPTPLLAHPAPILAKSTLKYQTFEPVDAMVPANTQKIELKERETEIVRAVAPLAYRAVIGGYNYGVPAISSPLYYY